MSWQALVLLHAFFSAFQALQFRAIARAKAARHSALAVNAVAYVALYVSGLLILPLIGGVHLEDFTSSWRMYVAASALFVMALYFMYKAMVHLESATASVLGTSSALFVVILANFFFDEQLTNTQILGIAILIPCLWYVLSLAKKRHSLLDFRQVDASWVKGFVFMMSSSFFLALAHILEKEILASSSLGSYVAFGWFLQLLFAWMLYFAFGQHAKKIFKSRKVVRSALQLGVLRAATGFFFVTALIKSDSVSLVTIVANFRIIIVAVLAGWVLGERKFYYQKLAAAAVSVIALSIIFWS